MSGRLAGQKNTHTFQIIEKRGGEESLFTYSVLLVHVLLDFVVHLPLDSYPVGFVLQDLHILF